MIEQREFAICRCDHPGCQAERNSVRDIAWKMYAIVFGVDLAIQRELWGKNTKSVAFMIKRWHFCEQHREIYRYAVIFAIAQHYHHGEINRICTDAHFVSGLGCWITFIDVLGGKRPVSLQFDYQTIVDIYRGLPEAMLEKGSLPDRVQGLERLL